MAIFRISKNKVIKSRIDKLMKWLSFEWRKKYIRMLFVLALLGTPIILFIDFNLNNLLIFYTLIAVVWYSRETMDLKRISNKELKELRKQYVTSIRPYLRLQEKAGENRLQLVNEGKGVAVNLQSVYIRDKQETRLLGVTAMAALPGSVTESFTPRNLGLELDPSVADFLMQVTYEDIEGRKYIAVFKSNTNFNDGFEIIKQETHSG